MLNDSRLSDGTTNKIDPTFEGGGDTEHQLGSLIEAAVGVPVSQPARRRIENPGEDYLVDPVTQVTSNQAAARGASKASGGNGTVVQGEGNVVNTQQVTHVHHHHYTTNNSEVNVNQPHRY